MIAYAYDRPSSLLVAFVWGPSTAAALDEFVTAFRRLDAESVAGRMPVTIIDVDRQAERLNALQRQTISDAFTRARSPVHLVAVVTTSSVHRGVGKVIAWLSPAGDRRRASFHATTDDAFRWCEGERGTPMPTLRILHDQVVAAAAGSSQSRIRKSATD
jgi:hypothetical protein